MIADEVVEPLAVGGGSPTTASKGKLRVSIALMAILGSTFLLLWQTTVAFVDQWTSDHNETYTHGSLITAIAFWLIFRNREKYARVPVRLSLAGLGAVVLTGGVWLIAVRSGIRTAHEVLFPLTAWLAVYAAMGRRMALACAFPFAFLLFQTIAWDLVSPALQRITVAASDILLSATSISAYVEGNLIHLPVGTFEVAGGCSGLHFLIVAAALGALYGELEDASLRARVMLLGLAVFLAMIANWVRVYVIVVAGYLTNMQHYLVRVEHYWFGWSVFAVTMIVFFFVARRICSKAGETPASSLAEERIPESSLPLAVIAAVAALAIAPLWNALSPVRAAAADTRSLLAHVEDWSMQETIQGTSPPSFQNADRLESAVFRRQGMEVEAHLVTYLYQTQDRELTSYRNSPLTSSSESVVERSAVPTWQATELLVEAPDGSRSVVQYGYVVGQQHTSSGLVAQLSYGIHSLFAPAISRAIVLRSVCNERGCDQARASLQSFASSFALTQR